MKKLKGISDEELLGFALRGVRCKTDYWHNELNNKNHSKSDLASIENIYLGLCDKHTIIYNEIVTMRKKEEK